MVEGLRAKVNALNEVLSWPIARRDDTEEEDSPKNQLLDAINVEWNMTRDQLAEAEAEARTKTVAEEVADQADPINAAFSDLEHGTNSLVTPNMPQYVQDALVKAQKAREMAHDAFLDLATAVAAAREQAAGQ